MMKWVNKLPKLTQLKLWTRNQVVWLQGPPSKAL